MNLITTSSQTTEQSSKPKVYMTQNQLLLLLPRDAGPLGEDTIGPYGDCRPAVTCHPGSCEVRLVYVSYVASLFYIFMTGPSI